MAIHYVDKIIKQRVEQSFVCDRCSTRYKSMSDAHIIRHTFGSSILYAGKGIEIVLCENCLVRLAFEWSAIKANKQNSKRKNRFEEIPFYAEQYSSKLILNNPVHPGEFLLKVYLKPARISITKAANLIGVEQNWMREFVGEKTRITQAVADKLAKLYGGSVECWLAMQQHFDSSVVRLKGIISTPKRAVSLNIMNKAIKKSAARAAK